MLSNPQSIILLRGCQYFQTSGTPVFEYHCWALTWQSFLLWLWGRRISGCIALTNQTRGALFYYHIPVKPDSSSTAETQSTPHGEQFGQCLTASSSASSWAIYFTANTLSDYWCVAPCHAAAVSLQDQKETHRDSTVSVRTEKELTSGSELATFALWTSAELCSPRQMVSAPQLPSAHSPFVDPLEPNIAPQGCFYRSCCLSELVQNKASG